MFVNASPAPFASYLGVSHCKHLCSLGILPFTSLSERGQSRMSVETVLFTAKSIVLSVFCFSFLTWARLKLDPHLSWAVELAYGDFKNSSKLSCPKIVDIFTLSFEGIKLILWEMYYSTCKKYFNEEIHYRNNDFIENKIFLKTK